MPHRIMRPPWQALPLDGPAMLLRGLEAALRGPALFKHGLARETLLLRARAIRSNAVAVLIADKLPGGTSVCWRSERDTRN